jgi:transcriptional regulator with XRE-family HTH domain
MTLGQMDTPMDDVAVPVGVALARLRRHAGLTGLQLGRQIGMSQAKVSKIETGAVNPTPEDVERLATALGAEPAEVERLTQQAEHERDRVMDWRFGRNDPTTWQREIADLEVGAHEIRVFQPAVISGLLQTSEFARSVLATVQEAWTESASRASGVNEAVTARVGRQQILDDPDKQFHFVIPETLLHNLLVGPEEMLGQLQRLRDVARQDNVSMRMIPQDTRWPYPPYHGFSLLDNRYVIIDLFNTIVVTRGQSDIRLYRQVFDALEGSATRDIGPILDRYRRQYLRVATEG